MPQLEMLPAYDTTPEALYDQLARAGLPLEQWGTGSAKTVGDLYHELAAGECSLQTEPNGSLLRTVAIASVDVFHQAADGRTYRLYEDRQEFTDGRTRRRSLSGSLGEKLAMDETPTMGAKRALQEELGIHPAHAAIITLRTRQEYKRSGSYPGLLGQFAVHSFVALVDNTAFDPAGYIEKQAAKTNYYAWRLIGA